MVKMEHCGDMLVLGSQQVVQDKPQWEGTLGLKAAWGVPGQEN